jgi:hypothetical protein
MNSDFNKRFKQRRDRFDKDFDRLQKFGYIVFAINLLIVLAFLSGVAFVVYKLMAYFGIS